MNLASITQTIALLPELARSAVEYTLWTHDIMKARINGTDPDLEGDVLYEEDHAKLAPLEPWQAGRLALEITTLIRSHKEFPKGHREAMDLAVHDVDSSQHAVDLIMALASMFAHVVTDEQIDMFSQSLVEAEAREA